MSYECLSPNYQDFISNLESEQIPSNIQVPHDPTHPKWREAINKEPRALQKGKQQGRCKWVFTNLNKPNGEIEWYKVRLEAIGFTQTYCINYEDTFAPVATIKFFFSSIKKNRLVQKSDWWDILQTRRRKITTKKKFQMMTGITMSKKTASWNSQGITLVGSELRRKI